MQILPFRKGLEQLVWKVKGAGTICTIILIDEIYSAVVTVRRGSFDFEDHIQKSKDLWKIQRIKIEHDSGFETWIITKAYNWNCFRQDLPAFVSEWIGLAGYERIQE